MLFFATTVWGLLATLFPSFRWPLLGLYRCTLVGIAVAGSIVDYKLLFRKTWPEDTEEGKKQRHEDYEATHRSAATRIRNVMMKLGGIYVKCGCVASSESLRFGAE